MVGQNLPAHSSRYFEMCPVQMSPERHGTPGASPTEGKKSDLGSGAFFLLEKAEGTGPVDPQEEMTLGELIKCMSI